VNFNGPLMEGLRRRETSGACCSEHYRSRVAKEQNHVYPLRT
jgi:hypothetical protein